MNARWQAARRRLAHTYLFRRSAEAIFRARCRRSLGRFERLDSFQSQIRCLLGLTHAAHNTAFGREHDFRRIRGVDDFRRLVPLRTMAELQRLANAAQAPGADAVRRAAVETALALAARERPHARVFDGTVVLLGDDVVLPDDPKRALPALVRPFANVRGRVNCVVGAAERVARYLEVCRPDDRVTPLAVLYTSSPAVSRTRIASRLGPAVRLMELGVRAGLAVTVEDPRFGLPRLLTDHGMFFEFLPVGDRASTGCERLTLREIDAGTPYELVVTAPGGWWACRTGAGVCFEQSESALLRFVPLPPVSGPEVIPTRRHSELPTPASRPRITGTAAAPPESFVHIPWSAPAGPG